MTVLANKKIRPKIRPKDIKRWAFCCRYADQLDYVVPIVKKAAMEGGRRILRDSIRIVRQEPGPLSADKRPLFAVQMDSIPKNGQ